MVPGPLLPPSMTPSPSIPVLQDRQAQTVEGGLKVTYVDAETDPETGETVFTGGVTATYGPTEVKSQTLKINVKTRTGVAEKGVQLTDPEGTVKAGSLTFNWEAKTGSGSDVVIQSEHVFIMAKAITVGPDSWQLTSAEGSLTRTGQAPVSFTADSVSLYPGRSGVARRVFVKVFGQRIGPLPRMAFSLRRRVKGIGFPSLANRKGKGFGIAWDAGIANGDFGVFNTFWEAFPRKEPAFGLQYGQSPLNPDSSTYIAPRDDLGERAIDGWFDNVSTTAPEQETEEVGAQRLSWGVGTVWNQATAARPVDGNNVSKWFDLAGEWGGRFNGIGANGIVRLQSVREGTGGKFVDRASLTTSLLAPSLKLTSGLFTHARTDLFGTLSEDHTFGWARFEAGLLYRPGTDTAFGMAFVSGHESGTPDFPFDGLASRRAFHARADFHSGPYTVRYLAKYDLDAHKWYDREYEIALVANAFEPYIVFRQFPSDTRIGVRFRLDNLKDRLTRRAQDRR